MQINEVKSELLDERYFSIDHPSGLKLLLLPKEKYTSTYALFAAKYGSVDTKIQAKDGTFYDIPEGTAHFLEHKLFESEDLEAFERFSKTGAHANAFTSFGQTAYLFSCSDNFKQNLEILLDFVQSPYFTKETVSKEQGIIGQEIKMGRDNPGRQLMYNLFRALYHEHPVRIDVVGTVESIAQITADTLYDCYRSFYNLGNMVLVVVGNFELDDVISTVDKLAKRENGKPAKREFIPESPIPVTDYIEEALAVTVPRFILGFKEDLKAPERGNKEVLETEVLLEIIAGKSSCLYKELLDNELICSDFYNCYYEGFGYSVPAFSGSSSEPKRAAEKIRERISSLRKNGISEDDFEIVRRKILGERVMIFNDIRHIGHEWLEMHFAGRELFSSIDIIRSLTLSDINARFEETFDDRYCALSVVKGE